MKMGSGKRKYNHRVKYIPKEKKLTIPKSEEKKVSKEDKERLLELWNNLKENENNT